MLYLVATPIGNLKDISLRALETLKNVDVIACEDTRNTLKLLNHYEIKKKLISYHKFNENSSADGIISLLKQGKNVAVVSDAGMPVISDPGQILVNKLIEENLEYTIIPGASASLSALILSGFDSTNFTFIGFLEKENGKQIKKLEEIKSYKTTLIFYSSPYDIIQNLNNMYKVLGDRKVAVVSEITKLHEKVIINNLKDFTILEPKGEYVIVVEKNNDENDLNNLSVLEHINFYVLNGYTKNEAMKLVAKDRKISKSEVYKYTIS